MFYDHSVDQLQGNVNAWLKANEYAVILHTNMSSHVVAEKPGYSFYILYEIILPAGLEVEVAKEELDVQAPMEHDLGAP